jgi:predicted nucleotidyltransferase
MLPPISLLATLRKQGAPESHLRRVAELIKLAECEPALLAIFLVGSYARGNGDRVSDLDLVAMAEHGSAPLVLHAVREVLGRNEVLNEFTGTHPSGGSFAKLVYLDFSSVEFHVFEPGTAFRLKRPCLPVWDPRGLFPACVVDGEPIGHADFVAYEYGDKGLIWELVDCIKWLSRGRNELAKSHLAKLVAEIKKGESKAGGESAA